MRPVGWHEIAGLAPLMVLIVLIGVYPRPFLDRISPAVALIAARFAHIAPQAVAQSAPTSNQMNTAPDGCRRAPGEPLMDPQAALQVTTQTLWVLLPESLILLTAIAMMTAGPFVSQPRRVWSTIAAVALLAAFIALTGVPRAMRTDVYTAVALNDAFGYYGRLFLLLRASCCSVSSRTTRSTTSARPRVLRRAPHDDCRARCW